MRFLICCLCLLPAALRAETPRVVADIAPVHSIVAKVMQGVGTPDLIIPPGASPHSYALRPSEARALSAADLVVWVGPGLTPWLEDPIETLAGQAVHFSLLAQGGIDLLEMREGVAFLDDGHDHGHEEEDHGTDHAAGHEDHDQDHKAGHAGHGHGDDHKAGQDDHAHETAQDEHDHGKGHTADPHAWLDPTLGVVWAALVADQLAQMDPENAATYRENAAAMQTEVTAFTAKWDPQFQRLEGTGFIVFHDAFQYFEAYAGLAATSAIQLSDAVQPGAARIAALRALLAQQSIACAFTEPQMDPKMIETVTDGLMVTSAVLDPLGRDVPLGPDNYLTMLDDLATSMVDCLSP